MSKREPIFAYLPEIETCEYSLFNDNSFYLPEIEIFDKIFETILSDKKESPRVINLLSLYRNKIMNIIDRMSKLPDKAFELESKYHEYKNKLEYTKALKDFEYKKIFLCNEYNKLAKNINTFIDSWNEDLKYSIKDNRILSARINIMYPCNDAVKESITNDILNDVDGVFLSFDRFPSGIFSFDLVSVETYDTILQKTQPCLYLTQKQRLIYANILRTLFAYRKELSMLAVEYANAQDDALMHKQVILKKYIDLFDRIERSCEEFNLKYVGFQTFKI